MNSSVAFRWDAADIAKLVMSVMILILHTRMFGDATDYIFPILRMAVPLFFMVSSFLFFRTVEQSVPVERIEDALEKLARYIGRSAKLYFFWFIFLIIPTAVLRDWFKLPWWDIVLTVPFRIVFGSTFVASWYLSASVVAMVILVMLRYRLRVQCRHIVAIAIAGYALALLFQPYTWVFGSGFQEAVELLANYWAPYNSFPVALFWMSLGLIFAANQEQVKSFRKCFLVAMCLIGIGFTYLERAALCTMDENLVTADVFLFLPIACVPCFFLLLRCRAQIDRENAILCRRTSTIIYCLHGTVSTCFRFVLNRMVPNLPIGPFGGVATLATCFIAAGLILRLSKEPRLQWLKFSW